MNEENQESEEVKVIRPFIGPAIGTAEIPGSKSITNRALVCALLSSPKTKITLKGALRSDDTQAMIEAASRLNADSTDVEVNGTTILLKGVFSGPSLNETVEIPESETLSIINMENVNTEIKHSLATEEKVKVSANMAGTVARFLLPVLAARENKNPYALFSNEQLQSRPLGELVKALKKLNAFIAVEEDDEKPGEGIYKWPLIVRGKALASGKDLPGGALTVKADQSSQFLSGLLLAAPSFKDGLRVRLANLATAVSKPYIDMTVKVMEAFGATVTKPAPDTYEVVIGASPEKNSGGYLPDKPAEFEYLIEPDASAASYFWAAAAITGGEVRVEGLDFNSLQGDVMFAKVLEEMGCEVTEEPAQPATSDAPAKPGAIIVKGPKPPHQLKGGEFDLRDFSDTTQTLAVVAAFASSPVTITGVGFIRRKESDRLGLTIKELQKLNVDAKEVSGADGEVDGMVINPAPEKIGHCDEDADGDDADGGADDTSSGAPRPVETYEDHRMAMSMSLLGLVVEGIKIKDPDCVSKTFPDFFAALEKLRPPSQVIAIDGPAASGKSSVARSFAAEVLKRPLKECYLDTGAMYRSVTWAALQRGIDLTDAAALAALATDLVIDIGYQISASETPNATTITQTVLIGDQEAGRQIRTPEVDQAASVVSAHPQVRDVLVKRQREWIARHQPAVVEGRDIGTVVVPEAILKIFLTANEQERIRRRQDQRSQTTNKPASQPHTSSAEASSAEASNAEAIAIAQRDKRDASRQQSPLQIAPSAVVLDTSELTLDEVLKEIKELYEQACEQNASEA